MIILCHIEVGLTYRGHHMTYRWHTLSYRSHHMTYYYTSEEFFLYKFTVDKRTIHHFSRQNELLTGT